jgi:hypothetical protein
MEINGNLAIQELFETVNSAIGKTNSEDVLPVDSQFFHEHGRVTMMAEDAFYYGGIDDGIDHIRANREMLVAVSELSTAIIFNNDDMIKQKTNHLLRVALEFYNLELGDLK